jgi:cell division protein FtsX
MAKLDTAERTKIPAKEFAFPNEEKEPLEDAAHVRNAIARFNQVKGVSEAEKDAAWKRIKSAAKKFGVEMEEDSRKELKPSPKGKK